MTPLLDITDPQAPLPMVSPQLVALDLDGTCLYSSAHGAQLNPRIRDAIRSASHEIPVVIATGRMYRSALPWALECGSTAPLICYQGAVIRELPVGGDPAVDGLAMGKLIFENIVSADVALRVLALARGNGWYCQAYQDERLLCEEERPEAEVYRGVANVPLEVEPNLEKKLQNGSVKMVCVILDEQEAARAEKVLRADLGATAHVFRSEPIFVEVTTPGVNKGTGLARLCAHMNIDIQRTVAVGDAPNDNELLEMAGYAVAVRGALPAVVARADVLCDTPQEGGVADVLSRVLSR